MGVVGLTEDMRQFNAKCQIVRDGILEKLSRPGAKLDDLKDFEVGMLRGEREALDHYFKGTDEPQKELFTQLLGTPTGFPLDRDIGTAAVAVAKDGTIGVIRRTERGGEAPLGYIPPKGQEHATSEAIGEIEAKLVQMTESLGQQSPMEFFRLQPYFGERPKAPQPLPGTSPRTREL